MIRAMINKQIDGINIEELKQNDFVYSLFLNNIIEYIEVNCDAFNLNKNKAYQHLGKVLYNEQK